MLMYKLSWNVASYCWARLILNERMIGLEWIILHSYRADGS